MRSGQSAGRLDFQWAQVEAAKQTDLFTPPPTATVPSRASPNQDGQQLQVRPKRVVIHDTSAPVTRHPPTAPSSSVQTLRPATLTAERLP